MCKPYLTFVKALLVYHTMQSYPMKPNNLEYTVFVTPEPKKSDIDHGLINVAKLSVFSHINQSPSMNIAENCADQVYIKPL